MYYNLLVNFLHMDYKNIRKTKILNTENVSFLNQEFAQYYQKKFVENHIQITNPYASNCKRVNSKNRNLTTNDNSLTPEESCLKNMNKTLISDIKNLQEWSNYLDNAKCSPEQYKSAIKNKFNIEDRIQQNIEEYISKVCEYCEKKMGKFNNSSQSKSLYNRLEFAKNYSSIMKNEYKNIKEWNKYINNSGYSIEKTKPYVLKKNAAQKVFYDDMMKNLREFDQSLDDAIKYSKTQSFSR
jgi:hypothetical protein